MPPQVGVSSPVTPGQSGSVMVNPDGSRITGNERMYRDITFDGGTTTGSLSADAAASTALTGTNNDLDYAAHVAGLAGNSILVEYIDPGVDGASISVVVVGTRITVNLATGTLTAASSTLTSSNTQVTDGDTVTIGSTVYRFKNTLALAYDVKIGADADTSMNNLIKAINATGVAGTNYFAGTLVHPTVSAGALASHAFVITALTKGTGGNAIATTTTAAELSWTGTTLAGGVNFDTITSTAANVATAVGANTDAAALVDTANHTGNDGSGRVTAMSAMALTGGSDGTVPLFTVKGACLVSLRAYCETTLAGASGTLVHGKTGTTNDLVASLVGTTLTAGDGMDSTGRVARGTALAATPLKTYFDTQKIFATLGVHAITAGKLHYIVDYIPLTLGAHVELT